MNFAVLAFSIGGLIVGKILNPVGDIDSTSENKYNFIDGFHVTSIDHDMSSFILNILHILKLLGR